MELKPVWSHWQGKNQFIEGLPWCNLNFREKQGFDRKHTSDKQTYPATYKVIKLSAKWDSIFLEFVYGLLLGDCGYQGDIYEPVVNFFTSGNFSFSFVSTSLAYITIPKNKRKTKSTWDKKLTTTYTYSTHVQGHTWSQTPAIARNNNLGSLGLSYPVNFGVVKNMNTSLHVPGFQLRTHLFFQ